jgi:hypothetical protein
MGIQAKRQKLEKDDLQIVITPSTMVPKKNKVE